MLTVVINDSGEDRVVELTYENLWRELKDISNAELLVAEDWFEVLNKTSNKYICFVEADCLVSSGYFSSQMGLFKKNAYFRKLAMLSSATGVNNWANRFYGYRVGNEHSSNLIPNMEKKSSNVYPVQVAYLPGSIIRVSMLKNALKKIDFPELSKTDLVRFSSDISLAFWRQGDGNRVYINPNATYVTTEGDVNDISNFKIDIKDLTAKFEMETI